MTEASNVTRAGGGLGHGWSGLAVRPPEMGLREGQGPKHRLNQFSGASQIPGYQIQGEIQGQGPNHKLSQSLGVRNQVTRYKGEAKSQGQETRKHKNQGDLLYEYV